MNIIDINTKLFEKADKELNERLDKIFEPIKLELRHYSVPNQFTIKGRGPNECDQTHYTQGALDSLRVMIFEARKDETRNNTLNDFLQKVNDLSNDVADINNIINR